MKKKESQKSSLNTSSSINISNKIESEISNIHSSTQDLHDINKEAEHENNQSLFLPTRFIQVYIYIRET